MPVFNNILAGSSGQGDTGYTIDQSLRFNDDDSAYLNRTAGTATSNDIGTFSFWTKRGNLGGGNSFFSNHSDANNRTYIGFDADTITMFGKISGSANVELLTTPVFRDPGAWYHIVIAVDVTQSTASNRVKIYVNGTQITDFGTATYPAQNTDLPLFSKTNHQVGAFFSSSIGDYYDGYLAEYHYIDGQQLAPSSFAETNSDTNQWVPVEYAGSYGNNGFYLKFQDASALGDDSSGNTNDFTANNLVATDQVPDSPSNSFATLNPLVPAAVSGNIFSEGNLKYRTYKTGGDNVQGEGTIGFTSGKWYWEIYLVGFEGSTARRGGIGVGDAISNETWTTACTEAAILSVGNLNPQAHNVVNASTGSSWSTGAAGDIWCCAFDADAGTFIITKNTAVTGSESDGKWTGFATSTVGYRPITVEQSGSDYTEFVYNFGQDSSFAGNKTSGAAGSDFYFTKPTGYKALNTSNLPYPAIADPTKHFNTVLYSGNGSSQTISSLNFAPDFTWIKSRSNSSSHALFDTVRGATKELISNDSAAEQTFSDSLTAFTSDGFTLGADTSGAHVNVNSQTYASWNWLAGGSPASNGNGSITSSVSANTMAGFSIVSYTGTGANATVGHGLSVAPDLVIVKNRDSTQEWPVGSDGIDSGSWAKYLGLSDSSGESGGASRFNSTAPTASVVNIGTSSATNNNTENHIMYCFHSVEGYSAVGKYIGTGATSGPFIYTGFSVAFLLVKLATAADGQWVIFDNKRDPDNPTGKVFYANINAADTDVSSYHPYDLLSNGFKSRIPAGNGNEANYNSSGQTYIYLAFAESPQKFSNAR